MDHDLPDGQAPEPAPRRQATPVEAPLDLPLDAEAFYLTHQELYHDWAEAQLGDRHSAEEAVHSAFTRIVARWDELLLCEQTVGQQAWKILRETVEELLKRQQRPAAFIINGAVQQALEATRDQFRVMHSAMGLYAAMAELPPRQFDAIVLRYVLGYSTRRIAWFLDLHERTVDHHIRRGKDTLRERMGLPAETRTNHQTEGQAR
ncbi:RNA polymerase sigma factor [Streptomyces hoynatensis]|uniref:Sigma-70 family RNA polymerase sigma factor n=1 Tax=Streptomyces hoynatensis TaxID=1141874 RepID=A0A3A9YR90_9ACTN|nr:sigma-70 family RNA polymerase sigma factor [Streptomyces hoynatensis]RKN38611.1 sigma-70 family RNA polymerase sigma factor [Streptomyces hoynatensis]